MKVELLHHTPLEIADIAISKCYDKEPYTLVEKQQGRINRVANVSKHSSTIEHLEYNFDIEGISRAVLQELARHRLFSFTVKSTRYTLFKDLKNEDSFITNQSIESMVERASKYIVLTGDEDIDLASIKALEELRKLVVDNKNKDYAKYALPECYKTSLVLTGNARVIQNFIALRTDSHALWEIQDLAKAMFEVLPKEHKFLFEGCVK